MCNSQMPAAAGLALVAILAGAGCGLKGPLALPEKSQRVIIRGPGETAGAATSPATSEATDEPVTDEPVTDEAATDETANGGEAGDSATGGSATGSPALAAPVEKIAPREERPPPPPLPGGSNPGSARGG